MNENPYDAPSANLEERAVPLFPPVRKPWGRWLVIVWLFVTFGVLERLLRIMAGVMFAPNSPLEQLVVLTPPVILLLLMFGVASLRKWSIVASAVWFVLVGLWQLANAALLLSVGAHASAVSRPLLVSVAPCCLAVWYLLRPSFLRTATKHRDYVGRLSMQKYMQKKMGRQ